MKKKYLAACIDIKNYKDEEKPLILFEKSGIQFIDHELEVNWEDNLDISFNKTLSQRDVDEAEARVRYLQKVTSGRFGFITVDNQKRLVRVLPKSKSDDTFYVEDSDVEASPIEDFKIHYKTSLRLFNGVWFPVPYFRNDDSSRRKSPINWARCRIVDVSDRKLNKYGEEEYASDIRKYHITFAFDTAVSPKSVEEHICPIDDDVKNGTVFRFYNGVNATNFLYHAIDDNCWLQKWTNYVFTDIGKKEGFYKNEEDEVYYGLEADLSAQQVANAHYLNVLSCLRNLVHPYDICLKTLEEKNGDKFKVSLVLDIGNSRCSGFLNEDDGNNLTEDFSECTYPLRLRDLNSPELEYNDTFESRIEFQKAKFDINDFSCLSGRNNAFIWRSLVRVGHEATRLSANKPQNVGDTGLFAPKRYLWNTERHDTAWNYNNYYYQIPYVNEDGNFDGYFNKDRGTENGTVCDGDQILKNLVTGAGDARFATIDEQSFEPNFSYKSATTLMLVEIILQAIGQMNSVYHRTHSSNAKLVRHLSNIVLTTPPAMAEQEREIYRFCAYEALGIVWKCLGYDMSVGYIEGENALSGTVYPYNFPIFSKTYKGELNTEEMVIPVPDVRLDWDEALASQFVYLYNEIGHLYKGNPKDFIRSIRRFDADGRYNEYTKYEYKGLKGEGEAEGDLLSARVASLDIGGGTTDLVITDYAFEANKNDTSSNVITRVVLKDGIKSAGDDILLDIMYRKVLQPLEKALSNEFIKQDRNDYSKNAMLAILGNGTDSKQLEVKNTRKQLVEQIFSKVASRIMSYLADLDRLPQGCSDCVVKGTIEDFINDKAEFSQQSLNREDRERKPFVYPEDWVIEAFNKKLIEDYKITTLNNQKLNIMNFSLEIDLMDLNRDFIRERIDVIKNVKNLASIVAIYKCDILLLTGRPTQIPGIRTLLKGVLPLSADRIIQMSNYKCPWYPIKDTNDSTIGDPKTTVSVGAILATKKLSYRNLKSFKINPKPVMSPSNVRFLGGISDDGHMKAKEVLYNFNCIKPDEANMNWLANGEPLVFNDKTSANPDNYNMVIDKENSVKEFTTTLVKTFGYRQFSSEDFPANYLYSLELVGDTNILLRNNNNLNSIFKVQKEVKNEEEQTVKELTFADQKESTVANITNSEYFSKIQEDTKLMEHFNEMQKRFDALIAIEDQIKDLATKDCSDELAIIEQEKRQQVARDAYNQAQSQVEQEYAQKSVGFFGKMFGGEQKLNEEKQARVKVVCDSIVASKEGDIQAYLIEQNNSLTKQHEEEITDLKERIEDLRAKPEICLSRIKTALIEDRKEIVGRRLRKCKELADNNARFTFKLHICQDAYNPYVKCKNERFIPKEISKTGKPEKISYLFDVLNSAKKLPKCSYIKIQENDKVDIHLDGENYDDYNTSYFVLKLKTCGGNDCYWTEDGLVYKA